MTIEIPASGAEAEASALPPPRSFSETSTLTVRQGHRALAAGWDTLAAGWIQGSADGRPLRVAIVAADPGALTLTF